MSEGEERGRQQERRKEGDGGEAETKSGQGRLGKNQEKKTKKENGKRRRAGKRDESAARKWIDENNGKPRLPAINMGKGKNMKEVRTSGRPRLPATRCQATL